MLNNSENTRANNILIPLER